MLLLLHSLTLLTRGLAAEFITAPSLSLALSLSLLLIPLLLFSSSVKLATSVDSALFYLTNEILKS